MLPGYETQRGCSFKLRKITFFLELSEDGKPKYTCEICGKSYIRSWSYYGHMREHASGEKQHKCEVCGKIFNYASNLRQHMLIHTGNYFLNKFHIYALLH